MKKLELATIIASRKIVRNFIWFYKLKIPRTVRTRGILDGYEHQFSTLAASAAYQDSTTDIPVAETGKPRLMRGSPDEK
jgi:hypothetical protein